MVNKSIFIVNKLITGLSWVLLFIILLVVAFISTSVRTFALHTSFSSSPLIIAISGLGGVVIIILEVLPFALVLRGIGWFFRTGLPYNTYLRISVIDILLRLFLGLIPIQVTWLHTCIVEIPSTLYLSIAIWAAVPATKRNSAMLLVGIVPGALVFALSFIPLPATHITIPRIPKPVQ